jgi:hypothetical protein
LVWWTSKPRRIASKVLMLKSTVPASWIADASQSMRRGSHDVGRHRLGPRIGPCSTLTASLYWR